MCCGSAQAVGCNPVRELTVKRNAYYIIIGVNALRTITLVNRTVGVVYLSVSLGYKSLCAVVCVSIGGDDTVGFYIILFNAAYTAVGIKTGGGSASYAPQLSTIPPITSQVIL